MKIKHVGIDSDILVYQAAFAVEARGYIGYDVDDNPVEFSKYKKNITTARIEPYSAVEEDDIETSYNIYDAKVRTAIRRTGATSCTTYLTGKGNFRNDLYDLYKSTRGVKPLLYKIIRSYIEMQPSTVVVNGQEADDALSIAQYKDPKHHCIATIDKDLLMVAGHHYHLNKDTLTYVTKEEGIKSFYKQILTGDKVDDITGIKGIGPKKAEKIIDHLETEYEMWEEVLVHWENFLMDMKEGVEDIVIRNARLLWMRSYEGEMWTPPTYLRE